MTFKIPCMKQIAFFVLLVIGLQFTANAQQFVSPTQPVETGKAPGVRVKLLSTNGETKTYVLAFSPGDEVRSGLNEFAQNYHVQSAHYTGIGDIFSGKAGFFDYEGKMFKVIPVDTSEITSFIGNIAIFNGKPVDVSVAAKDGHVYGGHLLQLF